MSEGQRQPFLPREFDVFAGLDVDKTTIVATFTDHDQRIRSMRLPYNAINLMNFAARAYPGQRVAFAYEAGPTGYGLYDDLTAGWFRCLVVSPSMVPTARGQNVKTNRIDSRKIAEGLRGGQLKGIRVPTESYRQLRHLIQLRDTFVRQAVATKLRIKALLLFEGIEFPKKGPGADWSGSVVENLKRMPCKPVVRFKLDQLIANLEFSQKQVLGAAREIRRFCKADADILHCIELLTTMPGIGWTTASHLMARIGDWRELHNVRELGSYLGLAQKEDSTGEEVRRGSISKAGDGRLRNKLIQSAWTAIRFDPELREFYRRIYDRHPKYLAAKKAIVAVARKMTMRIHAVLAKQKPYEVRGEMASQPLTEEEKTRSRERLDPTEKQATDA